MRYNRETSQATTPWFRFGKFIPVYPARPRGSPNSLYQPMGAVSKTICGFTGGSEKVIYNMKWLWHGIWIYPPICQTSQGHWHPWAFEPRPHRRSRWRRASEQGIGPKVKHPIGRPPSAVQPPSRAELAEEAPRGSGSEASGP